MERNLTTGSVFKNVVLFSLPYLLSYFLQTLYGMADLFIIGQFEGVASTTAVSIGSQVMHMLTVMIVGLAMGATVSIGHATGAGDRGLAARDVGNTATLFMVVSLILTIALVALVRPIVSIISTPQEAAGGTVAAAVARDAVVAGERLAPHDVEHAEFVGQGPRLALVEPHERRVDDELRLQGQVEGDVEALDEVVATVGVAAVVRL